MKRSRIIAAVLAVALFLALSFLCYAELGSFNLIRTAWGLGSILLGNEDPVQIAQYPHKTYLVGGNDAFESFRAFLESEGYELLVCEQMGSQFPVEKDGVREYIYRSANGYFQRWQWEEIPEAPKPYETAPPEKPVLYLYPEAVTDVTVKLDYAGELTCTYPAYENGWAITAHPDGTLVDKNGMEYSYLYWEGSGLDFADMDEGFCVAGADTAAFLEESLAKLGLNRREANEFIVYWLPLMEDIPYNQISFQFETYTDAAKLDISPAPDTVIRVFMAWKPLDAPIDLPPQILTAPERQGFTAVEWGGGLVE